MKALKIASLLLAGASMLVISHSASAQDIRTEEAAPVDESPRQEGEGDNSGPDLVVTGSRVIKDGNNSPTPVTVITSETLTATQPTTISDGLNNLPVFSGSRNQTGNPNNAGGNGAANQLNLRNLGANRNLILFDGHRVPPTLTTGAVDVDMIPEMLIQRVDMVTGGVSAVYGSDAISGVINFITDRNFNGVKLQAQAGVSDYGDAASWRAGGAVGTGLFGGRGHFEASYEYRNDNGLLYRSDRDWNNQWSIGGAGTAANPYRLINNVRLATTTFGGLITSGVLNGQNFKTNGVLTPFVAGTASGVACCQIGGDGAYYDASLKAPLSSHQLFGRFDFDFSDSLHFYAVGSANFKQNAQYIDAPSLVNFTMSSSNPFLAQTYRTQLATANQTTFRMSELMFQNAPRLNPTTNSTQLFFNAGFEGKIGDFNWGLSYIHGANRQVNTINNNVNRDRLSAALDAVAGPGGTIVCNVTITNPGLYPGCLPLNIFGPTASDPAAVSWVLGSTQSIARTRTDDVEFSISGPVFDNWAGPVSVALSGEWRRLTYRQETTAPGSLLSNCTGLRFNCSATATLWTTTNSPRTPVSQTVKEGAAEIDFPVLRDLPFFRELNVNGAARYTSYDISGNYWTWKVGLDWHVSDELRFRGTRSRDIRAPTLDDLYAPGGSNLITNIDLLTGLNPQVPLLTGGNPNLTAEIGSTLTAGMVFKPNFLPGFSLAIDYYDIKIDNAISSQLGYNATIQRACYDSGGTSNYCLLQTRPNGFTDTSAANAVTSWRNTVINIAQAKTHGIDVEASWAGNVFGAPVSLRGLVTYQPKLTFITPGLTTLEHAGVAFATNALYPTPKWRVSLFVNIKPTDNLTINILEKWRSPYTMKDDPAHVWLDSHVDAIAYTNINIAWDIEGPGKFQLFFNVQNLFNADPPPAAFYGTQTVPGRMGGWAIGDDPIGRYFTGGVRVKF